MATALGGRRLMQERYLGDVHDFIKYAFIRHLSRTTNFRLGLNWYLTDPHEVDGVINNDGAKRFHLNRPDWAEWDRDLIARLHPFAVPETRSLSRFYRAGILPSATIYADDHVGIRDRATWHQKALNQLADADHVFLDPDNGLEVKSATGRRCAKYARYAEIHDYLDRGQAVTCIQFARQCDPHVRAREVRNRLLQGYDDLTPLPVLRCRVAPNILLVSIAPSDKSDELHDALRLFSEMSPVMDAKGRRVEVIE